MNRNSRSAVTKLIATVLIAIGLLMIYRFWPAGPFSGLAIGCFGLTAGPILILVAIDTGQALRKEQLGRAARIATWLPQLILGSVACVAALCGFGLAAFDRSASLARFIWETRWGMSENKVDAAALVLISVAAIGFAGVIWFVGGNCLQRWLIRRVTHSLMLEFPVGTEFSAAKGAVEATYPRSNTMFTPAECEKWSHETFPTYTSKGGPCIFGLVEVSGPYVMEAGVQFKLIFGPDNRLMQLYADPEFTFL